MPNQGRASTNDFNIFKSSNQFLVYFGIRDEFASELILPNTNDLRATTHCENKSILSRTAFLPILALRPIGMEISIYKVSHRLLLQLFTPNYVRDTVTSYRLNLAFGQL